MYYRGINASKYDGVIDWKLIQNSKYKDFAILRACHGLKPDEKFMINYNNYVLVGKPIGYYQCVYATKLETIRKEANYFLQTIKPCKKPFLVFVDMEQASQKELGKDKVTELLNEWLAIVSKAGYECAVYTNPNWYKNHMRPEKVTTKYWWIAQYSKTSTLFKDVGILWQFTSDGLIEGSKNTWELDIGKADLFKLFYKAEH